ncbi:MAG: DUF4230 domain-containing protein [Lachnospiraceae bacterium]|nr:DUF4230 domain-containing protein [Lachnospiraceae bacterium]
MKKIKRIIISIFAVVLLCFGIFFGTKFYYSRQVNTVEIIREVPVEKIVEKEIQISGETIRTSMANIGKLCTAEYNYTHVEKVDSSKEIYGYTIPFTTSMFIYSYDGTIMAGIDFTKIQIDKNDTEKIITVTLPDVEIISSDVDQDSFTLYDEKNNIFNPISVTDVADSFADLKNSEEEKAIEKGLFDRARESAVTLVENFMRGSYDVEDYDIEVRFEGA